MFLPHEVEIWIENLDQPENTKDALWSYAQCLVEDEGIFLPELIIENLEYSLEHDHLGRP